jgi:hypothetical protein
VLTSEPAEQSQQEALGSMPNTLFSQDDIKGLQGEDDNNNDDNHNDNHNDEAGKKTGDTDQQTSA